MKIPYIVALICFFVWLIAFGIYNYGGIVHVLLVISIIGVILGMVQNADTIDYED